jgi:hypothetical protein
VRTRERNLSIEYVYIYIYMYINVCVFDKAISDKMILCNLFLKIVQTENRQYLFVLVESRQMIM